MVSLAAISVLVMSMIVSQHSPYSKDYRKAVCQMYEDGMTMEAIAEHLHHRPSTSTVSTIIHSFYENNRTVIVPDGREGHMRPGRRFNVEACRALNTIMQVYK